MDCLSSRSGLSDDTHQTKVATGTNSSPCVHTVTSFLYKEWDRSQGTEDSSETTLGISPGKKPENSLPDTARVFPGALWVMNYLKVPGL